MYVVIFQIKYRQNSDPGHSLWNCYQQGTSEDQYSHLVVVFGDQETSGDDAITRGIQEIQRTVTEKGEFSGSDFILTRLNQIQNQYIGLTRTR